MTTNEQPAAMSEAELDAVGRYLEEEREYAQDDWTIALFHNAERLYATVRALEAENKRLLANAEGLGNGQDALREKIAALEAELEQANTELECWRELWKTGPYEMAAMWRVTHTSEHDIDDTLPPDTNLQDGMSAEYRLSARFTEWRMDAEKELRELRELTARLADGLDEHTMRLVALEDERQPKEPEWEYQYVHYTAKAYLVSKGWEYLGYLKDSCGELITLRRPRQQDAGSGETDA